MDGWLASSCDAPPFFFAFSFSPVHSLGIPPPHSLSCPALDAVEVDALLLFANLGHLCLFRFFCCICHAWGLSPLTVNLLLHLLFYLYLSHL